MIQCSSCLKEVDPYEFSREGGLCEKCHKEIQEIWANSGTFDQVSEYIKKKRMENKELEESHT